MSNYWQGKKRDELWHLLLKKGRTEPGWDVLVVGGGITGAGILYECSRLGLDVALVEQKDFAWGTSSRSSKMIHGGLRYLASGDFRLSRDSVKERNRLLKEFPGLVDPLGFVFSHYRHKFPGPISFNILLSIYDLFAGQWNHHYFPRSRYLMMAPGIREGGLRGGTRFMDAVTDDARLVLRLVQDASLKGALALNYVKARAVILRSGKVRGVVVRDDINGEEKEVFAKTVINAGGAWTDKLRGQVGGRKDIRPLRGSHLVFPFWRLPVAQSITLMHPEDKRPVFIFPWEGVTVVGTTDLDHLQRMDEEPQITTQEIEYLLAIVEHQFPYLGIRKEHILSTYSGVRPVVHLRKGGKIGPSKERREHSIWEEKGLISIGGGKLTTYRIVARDVIKRVIPDQFQQNQAPTRQASIKAISEINKLGYNMYRLGVLSRRRLKGRYGDLWMQVLQATDGEQWQIIPGTSVLWCELRWAARNEGVVHLEDLLMRRTRLGILLRKGGLDHFNRIKAICQEELGWDQLRWEKELGDYKDLHRRYYSVQQ